MTHTAGDEITEVNLKMKDYIASMDDLTGCNLFDMVGRGIRDFRKAMAFPLDK